MNERCGRGPLGCGAVGSGVPVSVPGPAAGGFGGRGGRRDTGQRWWGWSSVGVLGRSSDIGRRRAGDRLISAPRTTGGSVHGSAC